MSILWCSTLMLTVARSALPAPRVARALQTQPGKGAKVPRRGVEHPRENSPETEEVI